MAESRLAAAMDDIRVQSGFDAAVLIDMEGKMLAEVHSPETQPNTVETLLQVASQVTVRAENKSGVEASGESEFFDWEGRRIVCRWFKARRSGVLVLLVPKGKSYKWATNRMVKELQHLIGA